MAVTAAVLNEVLERPRRERWSVLRSTRCSIWSARLGLYGAVDDAWLRENLVAIGQLAEPLDRSSVELAFRIVPRDWWRAQLPDRPRTAEKLPA